MFLPLPLFAFGIGSLFTMMMSMTADVCDLNELETGTRSEGVFGAIYWWMVKFGFAIAGLLSGVILWVVGFDQNVAAQPQAALDSLKMAYIVVPVVGTMIAMAVMFRYDLSEKKAHEIRAELEARRAIAT
jgi:GPH family glycoside/pentoside/hexuronide:cation symporter